MIDIYLVSARDFGRWYPIRAFATEEMANEYITKAKRTHALSGLNNIYEYMIDLVEYTPERD